MELALPALIVGTATKAVGTAMKGAEESRAAAWEADQYRTQSQQYRTAAAQDEAKRRNDLRSAMDTILAVRAGRGVGLDSPTGGAILDDLTRRAENDIFTAKTNLLSKADAARQAAELSDRRSRMALIAGDLGTIEAISDGFFKYKKATS